MKPMELVPQSAPVVGRVELAGVNIESLLAKAIDAKSAVDVMERLQVMRREMRAERAKESYDAAMADFQAACPIIHKSKAGAKNAYKYAPLDSIVAQVRELIRTHGFSFAITSEIEPGWCKAIVKVTHQLGHSEVSEFKVPIDNKNPMMSDPQRFGGAMTFAKRYAFCNAFGILTADEDIDGAAERPKQAGPSTLAGDVDVKPFAAELWKLLAPVRGTAANWDQANAWLWKMEVLDGAVPETAPHLPAKRFIQAINRVKVLAKEGRV